MAISCEERRKTTTVYDTIYITIGMLAHTEGDLVVYICHMSHVTYSSEP